MKKILKEYYQVSYLLETEDTRNREFGVYQKVNDNYLKWDYTVFVWKKHKLTSKNINDIIKHIWKKENLI